jgi:hypothetical protein
MSYIFIPLSGFAIASWAKYPAAKPSQVLIVNIKPIPANSTPLILSMPSITAWNDDYSPQAVNIPVYQRDFEEAFLGMTQVFYRTESTNRLAHTIGLGSAPKLESFSSKPPAKYSVMEKLTKMRIEQEKARPASLDLQLQIAKDSGDGID